MGGSCELGREGDRELLERIKFVLGIALVVGWGGLGEEWLAGLTCWMKGYSF